MSEPRWPGGPKLRGLMRARRATPSSLAAAAGLSVSAIHKMLNGGCCPSADRLARALDALGATHADLDAAPPLSAEDDPDRHARPARREAAGK